MTSSSLLRVLAVLLTILSILTTAAQATPLEARALKASTSTRTASTAPETNSPSPALLRRGTTSTKKPRTSTKSTSKKTKAPVTIKTGVLLPTKPIKAVKATTTAPSSSAAFCVKYIEQCYKLALAGQSGSVSVVYSCSRNGSKNTMSYSYGCSRDGVDLTTDVLDAIGASYAVYTTVVQTTVVKGKSTVTSTKTKFSTSLKTATAKTTMLSFSTKSKTAVSVTLRPASTSTVKAILPQTLTQVTTATITTTSYATSLVPSTSTQVFLGTDEIPVYEVQLSQSQQQRRALGSFCNAFSTACRASCAGVKSTVKSNICRAEAAPKYSLACVCNNGKSLTQHTLVDVMDDLSISTMTTLATSTSYRTMKKTTTIPKMVLTTRSMTYTSVVPITLTVTSLSTRASGTTTTYELQDSIVTTVQGSTATTEATATSTETQSVVTTTKIVLAATGYVRAMDASNGSYVGTLAQDMDSDYYLGLNSEAGATAPKLPVMAVQDDETGLYQLAQFGSPSNVLISEAGNSGDVYQKDGPGYSWLYFGDGSSCSGAGSLPAGSGKVVGNVCQTFVVDPLALDNTPGATANTVNLQSYWTNPVGAPTGDYHGNWSYVSPGQIVLLQVADLTSFSDTWGEKPIPITLRFPYKS